MKVYLSIILFSMLSSISIGQTKEPIVITWEDFEGVEFKDHYIDSLDAWYWIPIFNEHILKFNNERVQISGCFHAISKRDKLYWLSKDERVSTGCLIGENPMLNIDIAQCKGVKNINNSTEITVEGILKLNEDDIYQLNFILEKPKVVKK